MRDPYKEIIKVNDLVTIDSNLYIAIKPISNVNPCSGCALLNKQFNCTEINCRELIYKKLEWNYLLTKFKGGV